MPARLAWWQRLTAAVRGSWSGPLTSNSPELARLWQAPSVTSGVSLNENSALTYSAVWAAVSLLAGDIASLPLILYKRLPDGGRERFTSHPLYRLLHDEPNPEMASMPFRECLTAHLLTWGNAYAEIERDAAGRPVALWPLTPDRVAPLRTPAGTLTYRVSNPTGTDTFLRPADVLHVPGLGYDGTVGYSVVAKARESLGLGLAAERFGASFYGNGATFGGVLAHPGKLSDVALKHLRESIESRHQGVDKAHRFLMLEEGMSYTSLGIPPEDSQFLETRQFQVEEVARWFSVPPHKIGYLKYATYSNIEHQGIDYLTSSLRRWLVRWEQEINRKLIAASERRQQYVEHLTDAILRGDIQSRYAAYAIARQWGWMSVNDIRERENMNPLPDDEGQMYLVPLNMSPADRLDEIIDKQVAPDPTPTPNAPSAASDEAEDEDDDENEADVESERARTIEILRTDVELARHEAQTAQDALKAAVEGRNKAEAEAGLEGALRLETEARERELRDRVAAAEAVVASLTTKLGLLEELAARPTLTRADVVAPEALTREVATVRDAVSADAAQTAEALGVLQAAVDAQQDALTAQVAAVADRLSNLEAVPAAIVEPVVAQVAAAAQDTRAGLAVVTERQEQLEALTDGVTDQLSALTQRLAALEHAAEQAVLVPPDVVTSADLSAVRDALHAQTTAALEAVVARVLETRTNATEAQARAQAARDAQVVAAHRTLIVEALHRVLRIETDRARRAATPEKLEAWMERFYTTHADVATAVLLPAVRAHCVWAGRADQAEALTRRAVTDHVETSMRELRVALAAPPEEVPGAIARTLARWETERPAQLADALVQEGAADAD